LVKWSFVIKRKKNEFYKFDSKVTQGKLNSNSNKEGISYVRACYWSNRKSVENSHLLFFSTHARTPPPTSFSSLARVPSLSLSLSLRLSYFPIIFNFNFGVELWLQLKMTSRRSISSSRRASESAVGPGIVRKSLSISRHMYILLIHFSIFIAIAFIFVFAVSCWFPCLIICLIWFLNLFKWNILHSIIIVDLIWFMC
jgi:hypothetical protein